VIFVHNHPSDDPTPSQEDQEITRRLKETGDMLVIGVLDAENSLSREPVQRVVMGSKTGRSLCVWQKMSGSILRRFDHQDVAFNATMVG